MDWRCAECDVSGTLGDALFCYLTSIFRIWELAWPLSWMEIMTFMKELIITAFVGHLGPLELSSLVLAQVRRGRRGEAGNKILTGRRARGLHGALISRCHPSNLQTLYNVSGNAPMLGVVVAMETFCGQAYGAKKYHTVGVVLQVRPGHLSGICISFAMFLLASCFLDNLSAILSQRGLILTTAFNLATVAFWGQAEWLMVSMGQVRWTARNVIAIHDRTLFQP